MMKTNKRISRFYKSHFGRSQDDTEHDRVHKLFNKLFVLTSFFATLFMAGTWSFGKHFYEQVEHVARRAESEIQIKAEKVSNDIQQDIVREINLDAIITDIKANKIKELDVQLKNTLEEIKTDLRSSSKKQKREISEIQTELVKINKLLSQSIQDAKIIGDINLQISSVDRRYSYRPFAAGEEIFKKYSINAQNIPKGKILNLQAVLEYGNAKETKAFQLCNGNPIELIFKFTLQKELFPKLTFSQKMRMESKTVQYPIVLKIYDASGEYLIHQSCQTLYVKWD